MRLCIFVEQHNPTCELAWSFRFDRFAKGDQGLRVMLGIHYCPTIAGSLYEGAVLLKEERQHNLPTLASMVLDIFGGSDPGCFHWRRISIYHSCQEHVPFPGIVLQMINTVSQHNHSTLAEIQVGGSRSPAIQSRPLSLRLCHFWSPEMALRGKRFTSDDDVKQYLRN